MLPFTRHTVGSGQVGHASSRPPRPANRGHQYIYRTSKGILDPILRKLTAVAVAAHAIARGPTPEWVDSAAAVLADAPSQG